mmetsp:Transcript_22361/g.54157  ORF Transcript_22361/g.54157 Transcript_22361/m.54157 type:complete len:239 (+) Transcript_22361:609-1325(+)
MLMLLVVTKKFGVEVQNALEFESVDVEELFRAHFSMQAAQDRAGWVEFANLSFNLGQRCVISEVRFIQEDLVSKTDLLHCFIFNSLRLFFRKPIKNALGVDHCDDRIKRVHLANRLVHKKGLDHWGWISQPGGFNDDSIKFFDPFVKSLERLHKISANGATNTSVHDLDDLLIYGLRKDLLIYTDFSEFVLDDCKFHAMCLVVQDTVEQSGLAAAEKACEHGDWDFARHLAFVTSGDS